MTCILVLGHPRSGASLVASLLHNLGVYMNPTAGDEIGNSFEDKEFSDLHKEMLGGSWLYPTPYDFSEYHDRYEVLIKGRAKRDSWGYKNIGTSFVFQDIIPLIRKYDGDIRIIVVRRAAEESVASLTRRLRLLPFESTETVTKYIAAVDRAANKFNGPILTVSYRQILKTPPHHIMRLAEFAGVSNDPGVCDIVKPALCHFKWEYLQ